MREIIDVPSDIGPFANQLADAGVKCVIRYYNHRNSVALPSKCLSRQELSAIYGAGMSAAVVFQQRGGAGGNIQDLSRNNGRRDATRAVELAEEMGQPRKSSIYFAVDWDYFRQSELDRIAPYFEEAKTVLSGRYSVGVYGSGTVSRHLTSLKLVDQIWLAGATGWSGTQRALREGSWTIFQKELHRRSEIGGFVYDGNVLNPSFESFGQFSAAGTAITPIGEGSAALFKVNARSGLNLRSGPGESYRVIQSFREGTIVTGIEREGPWMAVDIEGDGLIDGYMFESFLEPVSGGLPLELLAGQRPIDIARAELNLNVREVPGPQHNPRIVMYHATTTGGAAPDETPWCSSFVNYCVEQAGLRGTRSKWARSWHESGWGQDVTNSADEGDIVVFRRRGTNVDGGHVGFLIQEDENTVLVLGGNQGNRISIARYPKQGPLGPFRYNLLSIRRA